LTVKASLIFGKRFTIFKTVNRFLKLNSSSLHARLIFNCRNSIIVGHRNPAGVGVRQHLIAGILPAQNPATSCHRLQMLADQITIETSWNIAGFRPWSEAGRIRPLIWPKRPRSGRIWTDSAKMAGIWQDPEESGWTPVKLTHWNSTTGTGRYQILAAFAKL
jgi:hypothetical protein